MKVDIRSKIHEALSKSGFFDIEDFSCNEPYTNTILIQYRYSDKNYYFEIYLPKKQEEVTHKNYFTGRQEMINKYVFRGKMHPGIYVDYEDFQFNSIGAVYNQITEWCKVLEVDLFSNHERKKIADLEQMISNMREQFEQKTKDIEDRYLTKEEADVIIKKLDEIEESFKSQLEAEIIDKEKLKEELTEIKLDFDKLKKATKILKKKDWLNKWYAKVSTWMVTCDKKKLLKNSMKILGAGTKLLGIETEIIIPDEIIDIIPQDIVEVLPENLLQTGK